MGKFEWRQRIIYTVKKVYHVREFHTPKLQTEHRFKSGLMKSKYVQNLLLTMLQGKKQYFFG